jgi:hypothetical protein
MKTFVQHLTEVDNKEFGATDGKFESLVVKVKCPRGHITEFDDPKDISHNRYRGNFIMWECKKCPDNNRHFNAQVK